MGNIEKFDIIAQQYDTPQRTKIATVTAEAIREHIVDGYSKTAIDYGCGTGLVGLRLLDSFGTLLFIDASVKMVDEVNRKIEEAATNNAKSLCCDFMREMPHGLHADYILLVQVLLHEKDIDALLARLYAILNEGGHLIIVDFDKNETVVSDDVHNGFDQKELADTLLKQSFTNVESNTFYHGEQIFMGQNASLFLMDAVKSKPPAKPEA